MAHTLSDKDTKRVQAILTYVEGMMKAKIPGGQNGPRGPTFPQVQFPNPPRIAPPDIDESKGQYYGEDKGMVSQNEVGFYFSPLVELPPT